MRGSFERLHGQVVAHLLALVVREHHLDGAGHVALLAADDVRPADFCGDGDRPLLGGQRDHLLEDDAFAGRGDADAQEAAGFVGELLDESLLAGRAVPDVGKTVSIHVEKRRILEQLGFDDRLGQGGGHRSGAGGRSRRLRLVRGGGERRRAQLDGQELRRRHEHAALVFEELHGLDKFGALLAAPTVGMTLEDDVLQILAVRVERFNELGAVGFQDGGFQIHAPFETAAAVRRRLRRSVEPRGDLGKGVHRLDGRAVDLVEGAAKRLEIEAQLLLGQPLGFSQGFDLFFQRRSGELGPAPAVYLGRFLVVVAVVPELHESLVVQRLDPGIVFRTAILQRIADDAQGGLEAHSPDRVDEGREIGGDRLALGLVGAALGQVVHLEDDDGLRRGILLGGTARRERGGRKCDGGEQDGRLSSLPRAERSCGDFVGAVGNHVLFSGMMLWAFYRRASESPPYLVDAPFGGDFQGAISERAAWIGVTYRESPMFD